MFVLWQPWVRHWQEHKSVLKEPWVCLGGGGCQPNKEMAYRGFRTGAEESGEERQVQSQKAFWRRWQ